MDENALKLIAIVLVLVVGGGLYSIVATQGTGGGSCSWKIAYGLTQAELMKAGVCSSASGSIAGTYYVNFISPAGKIASTTGKQNISIPCSGATFGTLINRYGSDQIYNQYAYAGTWIAKLVVTTPSTQFIQEAAYNVPLSCLQTPSTQLPYSPTATASIGSLSPIPASWFSCGVSTSGYCESCDGVQVPVPSGFTGNSVCSAQAPAPSLTQSNDGGASGDALQNQAQDAIGSKQEFTCDDNVTVVLNKSDCPSASPTPDKNAQADNNLVVLALIIVGGLVVFKFAFEK